MGHLLSTISNVKKHLYDSDEAGTKAALRAAPILREAGVTTRVIRMEPYKDPDEFIKNMGADAFRGTYCECTEQLSV